MAVILWVQLQFPPSFFFKLTFMNKKRRPNRSQRSWKIMGKKIIEYFFSNPHANSHEEISKKFDVDKSSIRKILAKELNRRFEHAKKVRNQ